MTYFNTEIIVLIRACLVEHFARDGIISQNRSVNIDILYQLWDLRARIFLNPNSFTTYEEKDIQTTY